MSYFARHGPALSGEPVIKPVNRQCFEFANAGAIAFSLKPPSPQIAKPIFFCEPCARARVLVVLMKGATIAAAAVLAMNRRRDRSVISYSHDDERSDCNDEVHRPTIT